MKTACPLEMRACAIRIQYTCYLVGLFLLLPFVCSDQLFNLCKFLHGS